MIELMKSCFPIAFRLLIIRFINMISQNNRKNRMYFWINMRAKIVNWWRSSKNKRHKQAIPTTKKNIRTQVFGIYNYIIIKYELPNINQKWEQNSFDECIGYGKSWTEEKKKGSAEKTHEKCSPNGAYISPLKVCFMVRFAFLHS